MIDTIMKNLWFSSPHTPTRQVKNKGKKQEKKTVKAQNVLEPVLEIGNELNIINGQVVSERPFMIDSKTFNSSGERDAILASSGMGKSYLMGVILEEILEKSNQVVFVFDPEGEWYTLRDRYNTDKKAFRVVGKKGSGFNDFPVDLRFAHDASEEDIVNAVNDFEMKVAPMVRAMIAAGVSCVFDMSRLGTRESLEAYTVIAEAIFRGENNLSEDDESDNGTCRKVRMIVDEAHVFAPQKTSSDHDRLSLAVTEKIAKRGRKRNLHLLVATQRPQSINKNVISQCNRFWLGGIQSEHDYKANKSYYEAAQLSLKDVQSFPTGRFCYSAGSVRAMIKSRKRHCKHGGATKQESSKPVLSAKEADELLAGFLK